MQCAEQGRVDVEGGRVAYRVYGGGARALLCVHGGPGCPSDYLESLTGLASDSLRVVLYDQLGCGASDAPDDPSLWTLARFVRELEQVRTALGLGRADVLGHSSGGILVQEWALAHPGVPRTLVLASTTCSLPQYCSEVARLIDVLPAHEREALRDGPHAPGHAEAFAAFSRRHLIRIERPAPVARALGAFSQQVYATLWGSDGFAPDGLLAGWDRTEEIGVLEVPALVTVGRFDEVPPACAETIHARIAGSELAVFERSAHLAHWEERDRYLDRVREFLDEH